MTKRLCQMAVLFTLGFVVSRPAVADHSLPDSGLAKPFHIALGGYSASDSEGFSTGGGFAAKFDYSFFRPTRHEAVATAWYGHVSGNGGHDWYAGSVEYRWRFGGHGIAYYGLGGGYLGSNGGAGSSGLITAGLGVDLGQFTLESRSLAVNGELASVFLLGYRF